LVRSPWRCRTGSSWSRLRRGVALRTGPPRPKSSGRAPAARRRSFARTTRTEMMHWRKASVAAFTLDKAEKMANTSFCQGQSDRSGLPASGPLIFGMRAGKHHCARSARSGREGPRGPGRRLPARQSWRKRSHVSCTRRAAMDPTGQNIGAYSSAAATPGGNGPSILFSCQGSKASHSDDGRRFSPNAPTRLR